MKGISDFINEKLKVSTKGFRITLEELIKVLDNYRKRKNYEYAVYIDLKEILEEYPVVLQYHGTYTDKNIIGEKIQAIQFFQYQRAYRKLMKDGKDAIFIHFSKISGVAVKIDNTEELNDIFGEEVLDKIYDYIVNN